MPKTVKPESACTQCGRTVPWSEGYTEIGDTTYLGPVESGLLMREPGDGWWCVQGDERSECYRKWDKAHPETFDE